MKQSLSISKARKNLPTLVKEVGQHGRFIPITVNGNAQAILLGYEEFMSILETAKLTVSEAGNIQDHGTVQLFDREAVKIVGQPIPPKAQIEPPPSSHATYQTMDAPTDNKPEDNHDVENNDEHHEEDSNEHGGDGNHQGDEHQQDDHGDGDNHQEEHNNNEDSHNQNNENGKHNDNNSNHKNNNDNGNQQEEHHEENN